MNGIQEASRHKAIDRRSFLKGSAAATIALGASSSPLFNTVETAQAVTNSSLEETISPGVCRGGCGAGCQMRVHARDGKIVKTSRYEQTNPNTTRVCNRGLTHALRVYAEDRLKYPMKRVGERGSGQWEQISWDEATTTITDKWKEIIEKHGATSIAFISGSGNITPDSGYPRLLKNALGATTIDPAQDRALYVAGPAAFGIGDRFCGSGNEDLFDAKHHIVWGYNPTESSSPYAHYTFRAKAEHAVHTIVIDPSYTITASKADKYVAIQPGTDGVLALSMSNVIVNEGKADEEFLAKSTVAPFLVKNSDGKYLRLSDINQAAPNTPEDLPLVRSSDGTAGTTDSIQNPVIRGKFTVEGFEVTTAYELLLERINEWPPEKASKVCDVPVDTIKELAHIMVDGPTSVSAGLGLDHFTNGVATYASIFALIMVAGQMGKPGASVKGAFSAESANAWVWRNLFTLPDVKPGPTFYSPALLNCMESGKYGNEDINIKAIYMWAHNLFGTQVGGVKWRKFFEDVELIVVADVVMTSSASYADIVLPVCHYFECESASGEQTNYIFYNAKSAEPLYESKNDFDITQILLQKMGLGKYAYKDVDDLFTAVFNSKAAQAKGINWDRVKKEESILTKDYGYLYGSDGMFKTPTGRCQFYQEKIPLDTDYGQTLDFMKERLPYWEEPIEGWKDNPLAEKFPLVFTSERSKFKVHTQYTRIPWLLEFEEEPYVMINPIDAKERGIKDQDYIRIFNDRGTCTLRARFNDGTRPGMVVIDHGWDQDQFIDGFYCDLLGSNITPVVANSYYFDTLIQMEKSNIEKGA